MEPAIGLALLAIAVSVLALLVGVGATVRVDRFLRTAGPPRMGLAVGSNVPREALRNVVSGEDLVTWLQGPSVLVFGSSACEPCRDLVATIGARRDQLPRNRIIMIDIGGPNDDGLGDELDLPATVAKDPGDRLQEAFRVSGTPHVFVIEGGQVKAQALGVEAAVLLDELTESHPTVALAEA